jgi:DNA-binding NarL/FixJ family response regulator
MDLLPQLEKNIWKIKSTMADWLLRTAIVPGIMYASKNRALLTLFYSGTSRKKSVAGCFTTGKEVLGSLAGKSVGILFCTLDLEDGNGIGDSILMQARKLQPSLRCILIIDHDKYNVIDAAQWQCPVIVDAADIGDGSEPWRMAMLAAIANTTYRSKSVPVAPENHNMEATIKLTNRERQMLECFALGLTNAEAAIRLNLSPQSTKTYSRNLLSKLGVNNRQLALLKTIGRGMGMAQRID